MQCQPARATDPSDHHPRLYHVLLFSPLSRFTTAAVLQTTLHPQHAHTHTPQNTQTQTIIIICTRALLSALAFHWKNNAPQNRNTCDPTGRPTHAKNNSEGGAKHQHKLSTPIMMNSAHHQRGPEGRKRAGSRCSGR